MYPDGVEWAGCRARIVIGIAATTDEHITILQNIAERLGDMEMVEKSRCGRSRSDPQDHDHGGCMITTVTFNPAIDKTAQVPQLIAGGLNRLENIRQDAGGKGINVSKTLKAIGGTALPPAFWPDRPASSLKTVSTISASITSSSRSKAAHEPI